MSARYVVKVWVLHFDAEGLPHVRVLRVFRYRWRFLAMWAAWVSSSLFTIATVHDIGDTSNVVPLRRAS